VEPTKHPIVSHLRRAFHDMGDPLTRAPLPEPWFELLHRLDEKEREGAPLIGEGAMTAEGAREPRRLVG